MVKKSVKKSVLEEGIDEYTAKYLKLDKEEISNVKSLLKIMAIPVIALYIFSVVRLFYMEGNWGAYFIVMRVIFLSIVLLAIFLFSTEDFDWRVLSATITICAILIDIIAQVLHWYEVDTSTESIQYDFFSHSLAGMLAALVLSNVIRNKNKEIWVVVISLIAGALWEVMELIINLIQLVFLENHLEDFLYNGYNSLWDILAHAVGTAVAAAIYLGYKYAKCPPESRQGILCRI